MLHVRHDRAPEGRRAERAFDHRDGEGYGADALAHSSDIVVSPLPNPHVYGSCVFNAGVMAGSTLVLLPRFSEEGVLTAIQEHRATMFDCVPTAYYYLLAHPKLDSYDLSSLTRCTVGGQTLAAAKWWSSPSAPRRRCLSCGA